MTHEDMVLQSFIVDMTQDITDARSKSWLKTAIISHCCRAFPAFSQQSITKMVEQWYAEIG